jgi:hypothetical protein
MNFKGFRIFLLSPLIEKGFGFHLACSFTALFSFAFHLKGVNYR